MTEKQMGVTKLGRAAKASLAAVAFAVAVGSSPVAGAQTQQPKYPVPGASFPSAPQLQLPTLPTPQPITPNGAVVEDVIARVNDQIITRSEYERAEQGLIQDAQQSGASQADLDDKQKNLLRDMIDQQILLSKGKELGITGDAETMRQLDDIRKQNHLDSMEALQKAAEQQGVSFEDFKQGIKDRAITQEVVRDEVGRHINLTRAQEQAYYDAHASEFMVPEQIHLSEILIPTPENATDAQISAAQTKADDVAAKIKGGANFADLAKTASGGPTASAGGDLGDFKRGTLGQVLEDATFPLAAGGVTAPIRTRQGFVILRVDSHQAAGVPPLAQVEPQVQEAVYMTSMQPALRAYLTKARDEAYVDIKPGFVDTGSDRKESKPTFTAYAAPAPKKKVVAKQRMESEKAAQAQAALAASRERVAERTAEKAAENAKRAGDKDVSVPVKPKKIHREKIRYGQAPRTSLPTATVATVSETNAPLQGQAPGVAMAPTESVTSITTGVGVDSSDDPLAPKTTADHKVRFSDREKQAEEDRVKTKVVKTTAKATTRPVTASTQEKADEKEQSSALGLNGDTAKKKKKRQKGDPKERMQDQSKPAPTPAATPAPTVNPNLAADAVSPKPAATPAKSSDATTLPPSYAPAPGANPTGQPIPATTSADPGAPTTTPAPH
jgi:peptidyl-prolyl cis-trans isomerase SurA